MVLRTLALHCQFSRSVISVWSSSVLKTVSLDAMPFDSMLTSIGLTVMSLRILRTILSFGSASTFGGETAPVFNFPGMCAITKLICNTKSRAFQSGGGFLVWKNLVTDLLSVLMMAGLVAPQQMCPNTFSAR